MQTPAAAAGSIEPKKIGGELSTEVKQESVSFEKYESLKTKFNQLRKVSKCAINNFQEYVKALGSWESNTKELEAVTAEKG